MVMFRVKQALLLVLLVLMGCNAFAVTTRSMARNEAARSKETKLTRLTSVALEQKQEEICPICRDELTGSNVADLGCHAIHQSCLEQSLNIAHASSFDSNGMPRCPVCRNLVVVLWNRLTRKFKATGVSYNPTEKQLHLRGGSAVRGTITDAPLSDREIRDRAMTNYFYSCATWAQRNSKYLKVALALFIMAELALVANRVTYFYDWLYG